MIASAEDVLVLTEADFDALPDDGMFEVVDGRPMLMPGNFAPHQNLSFALCDSFTRQIRVIPGYGFVRPTLNVFIPRPPGSVGIQNRIPDLVIARKLPAKLFQPGSPPELAIEILSTRYGNVERSEKLNDYALAGIGEYWIFDPFGRRVEVYVLRGGSYVLRETVSSGVLSPVAFPKMTIDLVEMWSAIDDPKV